MVRTSTRRRAAKLEARGVIVYDFDGADTHDARALTVVAIARWQAAQLVEKGRITPERGRAYIRDLVEWHLKVRPRLEKLRHAEEEVAQLLRGIAAEEVIFAANRNERKLG